MSDHIIGRLYPTQVVFQPQMHLVGGGGEGNVSDGGTLAAGLTFPAAGLKITDADAHTLTLKSGNLSGNRTLDLSPSGNFTVAPGGNVTLGNASLGNLTIAGNVTGGNHSGNNTGDETGAGILAKLAPGATIGQLYVCEANNTLTLIEAPAGATAVAWEGNTTKRTLTLTIANANTTRLIIDGGQGLDDRSTYNVTLTAEGDAEVSGGEIVFSGDGCIDIDADFDLGVGAEPFQIEGFVTMADLTAGGLLLMSHGGGAAAWNSSNGHQYILGFVDSGTLELKCDWWNGSGISSASVPLFDGEGNATTALANGTQTYVCVNYDGTNLRVYIGDTRHHQGAATFGGTSAATLLRLGKTASGDQNLTGSIEHFRVQMGAGISVHTAETITEPTPPFTN